MQCRNYRLHHLLAIIFAVRPGLFVGPVPEIAILYSQAVLHAQLVQLVSERILLIAGGVEGAGSQIEPLVDFGHNVGDALAGEQVRVLIAEEERVHPILRSWFTFCCARAGPPGTRSPPSPAATTGTSSAGRSTASPLLCTRPSTGD